MLPDAPRICTDRLELVPLRSTPEHAQQLLRLWNSQGYRKFSIAPLILTEDDAQLQITRMLTPPTARYWLVQKRDTGEAIGELGYLGNQGLPGFGWTIAESHWRKGYGHEAARAALDWGFATAGLELVEVWLHPGNLASRALAMKLGFERVRLAGRPMEQRPQSRLTEVWHLYPDSAARHLSEDMEQLNSFTHSRLGPIQPQLDVRDMTAELEWFTDRLGFSVAFAVDDHAVLQRGSALLHLDVPVAPKGPPAPTLLRLPIAGLEQFVESLPADTLAEPLQTMPWGIREAMAITPTGHKLVLTEGL